MCSSVINVLHWCAVVHKQMSFLTSEGLSTTFEGLANVYFSHISNKHTLKVISEMLSSDSTAVVIVLCRA